MRTRALAVFAIAAICAAIVLGLRLGREAPKKKLSKYLSRNLPASLTVRDVKFSSFQKDPEFFWALSHSAHDLDPLLGRFRLCDTADKKFVQQALTNAFPSKFVPETSDLVYNRDSRDFDVFVLLKERATNSWVIVLTK